MHCSFPGLGCGANPFSCLASDRTNPELEEAGDVTQFMRGARPYTYYVEQVLFCFVDVVVVEKAPVRLCGVISR